jgi:lipopolysaccharide heptosyltransferase II
MEILTRENLRILITRADRIGDLVLSVPVFYEIRRKFPKAYLAALTFLENREILEGNPYLDEGILYDKKGSEKSWFGQFLFSRRIAAKKFDIVIHLHATNRMHWMSWLAGIPERIGWDRKSAWALTQPFADTKKEGLRHESEYNFDLLAPLGISAPAKPALYFPVTEKHLRSLEVLLRQHKVPENIPWIVLSPGASCPSKRWPAWKFGMLAEGLAQKYEVAIVGVGTDADKNFMETIQSQMTAPFYDLSGHLSLGLLAALLQKSALLISNDSGPVHIASAMGTPVVSIFGRNQPGLSPKRWKPLGEKSKVVWKDVGCNPCLAHACQINFLCLDVISEKDVLAEAGEFLRHLPLKKPVPVPSL